jgi:hypothetical protein
MGFLSHLFGSSRLNADPVQQKLAGIIIEVAEGRQHPTDIVLFLQEQGWSRSDQGNRLTHALSMVKVFRADLYPDAKEIGRQSYIAL